MVRKEAEVKRDELKQGWNRMSEEMLDHIVASRSLLRYLRGAEIHNEALPDESGAFRQDVKFPESDHAPVVAEFDFP